MKTLMQRGLSLLCLAISLAITLAAAASDRDKRVERDFGNDHFAAGGSLKLSQPVGGDLFAAGGNVDVEAAVGGDAVLSGGNLRINGPIVQDLYAAGGQLMVNASMGRNARVAGGQLEFGPQSEVAGNLSVGGGQVTLKGRVKGYVQAAGGTVLLNGVFNGDVEARSGQVELGPNARISGKLRYASRAPLKRDPAAQVLGGIERIEIAGGWPLPEDVEHGMGRAGGWIWSVGLMLLAGLLVGVLPGFYGRVTETLRTRVAQSLLLGFVSLVCWPAAALIFLVTLIGAPLGLLVLALYFPLLMVGYVSSGIALGAWVLARIKPAWRAGGAGLVVAAMLGVLALSLLARLPWVGGWFVLLALLAGLGALTLQAWRAREGVVALG